MVYWDVIQPLINTKDPSVQMPLVPYLPVIPHFGVAPRIDSVNKKPNFKAWSVYHCKGGVFGPEMPDWRTAARVLVLLQQDAEFQKVMRAAAADPEALTFPGFDYPAIVKSLEAALDVVKKGKVAS